MFQAAEDRRSDSPSMQRAGTDGHGEPAVPPAAGPPAGPTSAASADAAAPLLSFWTDGSTAGHAAAGARPAQVPRATAATDAGAAAWDLDRPWRSLGQGDGGGTQPVPASMESLFGRSFPDVRIHTGEQAAARAAALGTPAFTEGRDIYFGAGAYQPHTAEGRRILGHELAHTIQQSGARPAAQPFSAPVGPQGDACEQEAGRAGDAAAAGVAPQVELRTSAPAAQRFESNEHAAIGDEVHRGVGGAARPDGQNAVTESERARLRGDIDPSAGGGQFNLGQRGLHLSLRQRDPHTNMPASPEQRHDVPVSYGEMVALSGDFYFSMDNLLKAPADEVTAVRDLVAAQRRDPTGANYDILFERATQWRREGVYQPGTGSNEGSKGQYWGVQPNDRDAVAGYFDMAQDNDSHFNAAAGATAMVGGPEGNYAADNHQAWVGGHGRAVALAQQARQIRKRLGQLAGGPGTQPAQGNPDAEWKALENQAYIHNAGADHYLTDAFSAGHLFNKAALRPVTDRVLNDAAFEQIVRDLKPYAMREPAVLGLSPNALGAGGGGLLGGGLGFLLGGPIGLLIGLGLGAAGGHAGMSALVERKLRSGLAVFRTRPELKYNVGTKLVHDYLNRVGANVVSRNGRYRWVTRGDAHMDAATQDIASRAVLASRNYIRALIHEADADLARPENADDAWEYTPNVDGSAMAAMAEPWMRAELRNTAHLWELMKAAVKAQDMMDEQQKREQATQQTAAQDRGGDWGRQPSNRRFTNRMIVTRHP